MEIALTGKDICDIIRQCAKSGVLTFKLGDLEVELQQQGAQWSKWQNKPKSQLNSDSHQQLNLQVDDENPLMTDNDHDLDLSLMDVADPAAFEEMLMRERINVESEKPGRAE